MPESPSAASGAERFEHFLILVGIICDEAEVAGLEVQVETVSGRHLRGVAIPPPHVAFGEPEVGQTGLGPWLSVAGEPVLLTDVAACAARSPVLA